MIPLRVKADTKPPVAPRSITLTHDHPLALRDCPVCDVLLVEAPIVLVFVGFQPGDRKPSGWATGAAVAVHRDCAGYTEAELTALAEEQL